MARDFNLDVQALNTQVNAGKDTRLMTSIVLCTVSCN